MESLKWLQLQLDLLLHGHDDDIQWSSVKLSQGASWVTSDADVKEFTLIDGWIIDSVGCNLLFEFAFKVKLPPPPAPLPGDDEEDDKGEAEDVDDADADADDDVDDDDGDADVDDDEFCVEFLFLIKNFFLTVTNIINADAEIKHPIHVTIVIKSKFCWLK